MNRWLHRGMLALALALTLTGGVAMAEADGAAAVAAGEALFAKNCAACHSVAPGVTGKGPNLQGVVNRKAGTLPGYHFSRAMEAVGLTWTEDNLRKYLSGPQSMIPCHAYRIKALVQCTGIAMTFPGFRKTADAEAVIAYLKTR